MIQDIEIARLLTNVQTRVSTNEEVIANYAEKMKEGAEFPPCIVFSDGKQYWLADGYHRTRAAQANGSKVVHADIRKGGFGDALAYALLANVKNGLRLTNADKRRNVVLAWENRAALGIGDTPSNGALAKVAGVTKTFVQTVFDSGEIARPKDAQRTGIDGKDYHVSVNGLHLPCPPPPVISPKSAEKATFCAPPPPPPTPPCGSPSAIAQRATSGTARGEGEPSRVEVNALGERRDTYGRAVDRYGIPLDDLGASMDEARDFMNRWQPLLRKLDTEIEEGAATQNMAFSALNCGQTLAAVRSALNYITGMRPWCVCRRCHGHEGMRESCGACNGRGWQTRDEYKRNPTEFKDESDR